MPLPLNQLSGMPQMSAAFSGWTSPLTFERVTQTVTSGGWIEDVLTPYTVKAVWQPLTSEEIALKPDGQRSWEWFMVHIEGKDSNFQTNDKFVFRGIRYKIMGRKDYTLNNYIMLEVISDYQDTD